MFHKWGAQIDGLRVDLISLDLEPDLDNANVGKYMSLMDRLVCRCSLFLCELGAPLFTEHFRRRTTGIVCCPAPFLCSQEIL